jgi:DNA replication protein DnaC
MDNENESLESRIERMAKEAQAETPKRDENIDDDRIMRVFGRMRDRTGFIPAKEHIEPLKDYLRGYGLILGGNVGGGKTFFFLSIGIKIIESVALANLGKGALTWIKDYADGQQICIDDLGREPTVNEYGNKSEILADVIAYREARGYRTHFTTNLTGPEISARYGDRAVSRLMNCKRHELKTPNRRKPKVYEA